MKRLALISLAALAATGCGDEDSDPSAPSTVSSSGEERYLFVQSAGGGTLTPSGDSGAYRLELESVSPHVLYFSDRPARDAGRMATASYLSQVFEPTESDPNAALVTEGGGDGEQTLPFALAEPSYDESAATLSYVATPLDEAPDGLASFDVGGGNPLPRDLGRLELFIDSTSYHRCFGKLINNSSRTFTFQSKDPNDSNLWNGIGNLQTIEPGESADYTFKFHSNTNTRFGELEFTASGTSTKLKTTLGCDETGGVGSPIVSDSYCDPEAADNKKYRCASEGGHGRTIHYTLDDK